MGGVGDVMTHATHCKLQAGSPHRNVGKSSVDGVREHNR